MFVLGGIVFLSFVDINQVKEKVLLYYVCDYYLFTISELRKGLRN